MYKNSDHTFVVSAYKETPHLEDCIQSLLQQTVKTTILISTSTLNEYIVGIAEKYQLKIVVNHGLAGCANDWNYGFNHAQTALVTIAHQDDIYDPDFSKEVLAYANKGKKPLVIYTDYYEIRNNKKQVVNVLLTIKRLLNIPMLLPKSWSKKWVRRRVLSFGNAISCPTVTLNKELLHENPYDTEFKCSCDYMTWTKIAYMEGEFIYIPKPLMGHRIHQESHTTKFIEDNTRQQEDLKILLMYWPKWIGVLIHKVYMLGTKFNKD